MIGARCRAVLSGIREDTYERITIMKNLRHYIVNPLPISVLLGLVLSLTQLATTNAQTTDRRDEIRARIRQLEEEEKKVITVTNIVQDLIPLLDSDKYVVVPVPGWGAFPMKREEVEERASILILTGQMTPEEVVAKIQVLIKMKKQYQAELRKQLPELERKLAKTRADYSFWVSELARLNEKASKGQRLDPQGSPAEGCWKWSWQLKSGMTDEAILTLSAGGRATLSKYGLSGTWRCDGTTCLVDWGRGAGKEDKMTLASDTLSGSNFETNWIRGQRIRCN